MRCVCITPNASVDATYRVDRLTPGGVMRVSRRISRPGGKGNNVARVLHALGHDVVASGFAGGEAGRFIERELQTAGIQSTFVRIPDESRTCLAIVEDASPAATELLEAGPLVTADAEQALLEHVDVLMNDADAVVLSGSLPRGARLDLYRDLVFRARARGLFVAFDSSGAPLAAGLTAKPDLVKPNWAEVRALMGKPDADLTAAVTFAQERLIDAASQVLLSLGADGAILISAAASVHLPARPVPAVNTVGAGDAMVAGYLDAWWRGEPAIAALERATAVAAASTLQLDAGTVNPADVARLLGQSICDARDGPCASVSAAQSR